MYHRILSDNLLNKVLKKNQNKWNIFDLIEKLKADFRNHQITK